MYRKFIFVLVLFSACSASVFGKSDLSNSIIVITVCDVPSIILYRDKTKNEISIIPAVVFFADPKFKDAARRLTNMPKEKIKSIAAARFAIPVQKCGVLI